MTRNSQYFFMKLSDLEQVTPWLGSDRIENMADSVYSIAMTLMVLGINVPILKKGATDWQMLRSMAGLGQDFLDFLVSFILIAIFWITHHRQFHYIKKANGKLLWINLLIMLCIVLIPFSTSMFIDYEQSQVAALLLESNILITGLLFFINWSYASHRHKLIAVNVPEAVITLMKKRTLLIPAFSLLAIGLSFFTVEWSILPYIALPFFMEIFFKG